MVFDDNFPGDIIINEVRVPKAGEATYTYYETLGWRGKGAGYAGIQAHPKAHLFIFSIWDHKEHKAPIKAVHHGPGTETVGFGGEGTGLKSWNFKLGWKTDVWYTLVARNWQIDDHTHYGFWSRAGDTKRWTHLVTMDVAAKANFEGRTDAFIEDWLNTGIKPRTTHLRGGWKRKLDGSWFAFGKGRYSVNYWDLDPGKRSFNFRTNWDGGVAEDKSGKFYYMVAGGKQTKPTSKNPSQHAIVRDEKKPGFDRIKIKSAAATLANNELTVSWKLDDTTTPQFAYQIEVLNNRDAKGKPLWSGPIDKIAHARKATIKDIDLPAKSKCFVQIRCTDILDQQSASLVVEATR
ncbi:MAG: hypothetical protein CMJ78_04555 [Planctomycetaceae bacterium]|nr:hypothetical protein [Planctomycetaceae bacterium]